MSEGLETKRTILRPFVPEDAAAAFAWFSDTEIMQFIPGGPDRSMDDTAARIDRYIAHQAQHGFSKYLISHRETGQPIGDSGLYHLPDGKRIELGFRFTKPFWGAGYAMEVGRAWIREFETRFPGQKLFADVHPSHARSQRVLEKLGFQRSHAEVILGMEMLIYQRG